MMTLRAFIAACLDCWKEFTELATPEGRTAIAFGKPHPAVLKLASRLALPGGGKFMTPALSDLIRALFEHEQFVLQMAKREERTPLWQAINNEVGLFSAAPEADAIVMYLNAKHKERQQKMELVVANGQAAALAKSEQQAAMHAARKSEQQRIEAEKAARNANTKKNNKGKGKH